VWLHILNPLVIDAISTADFYKRFRVSTNLMLKEHSLGLHIERFGLA